MASVAPDPLALACTAMIESQLMPCGIIEPRLIAAFAAVPRERFILEERAALAYAETVQPIGEGRWMAAPLATARLLMAAEVAPGERVLLIGAGTGYTAALLAEMGATVIAVEAEPRLAERARALLAGWPSARLVEGPLGEGWPDDAPYDAILFDGAIEFVPGALVAQLKANGRMVAILVGTDGIHRVGVGRAPLHPTEAAQGQTGIAFDLVTECPAPPLPTFRLPKTFQF